jgi:crotonobetainyl-CoA:carnitine CoA-transferase CaiB-like acyl-CoA transferase
LGQQVQSALFENNVFLVAQHMMQFAMTGQPAAPMPARISAWGIYDVFNVQDGEQIFLAVVSDTQWSIFCRAFGFADWLADERLRTNNDRVRERAWLIPALRERLQTHTRAELAALFEREGLPFAPITAPHELLDDPHLLATGGLAPITLPDGARAGQTASTALLPLSLGGERLGVRRDPPRLGQDSVDLLTSLGYDPATAERLSRVL